MKLMRKMVAPIIWVTLVSFGFLWGIQSVMVVLHKESTGVGKIFGQTVSYKEYQDAMHSAELLMQKSGDQKVEFDQLQEAAWQNLTLQREAKRLNIQVTNDEVKNEIQRMFGEHFDPQFYADWVRKNFGEPPRAFEERVRNIIQIRKLVESHKHPNVQVSEQDVKNYYFNHLNKITLEYEIFPNEAEASKNLEQIKSDPNLWESRKKDPKNGVKSLGPISIDLVMAILGISQEQADALLAQNPNEFSKPISVKGGFAVLKVIKTEKVPQDQWTDALKEENTKKLAEEKKQTTFFEWWNDVMSRAKVERFDEEKRPSPSS